MIITELQQSDLQKYNLKVVQTSIDRQLKDFDSSLVVMYNSDDEQYEVYRTKYSGLNPTYHWQISIPKGQSLSNWVIDWLKKHDTNPMGMKSKEDLERNFLRTIKQRMVAVENQKVQNYRDKVIDPANEYIRDAQKEKKVFGLRMPIVPTCVGINKKTGKKIYAYKK